MCGIAVILRAQPDAPVDASVICRMTEAVAHRGPDDAGVEFLEWPGKQALVDRVSNASPWQVALGHRRLSILDLSPAGHQPMSYQDGTYWVTYNGEIYNFVELRTELEKEGFAFRSSSDTEVLLAAYAAWGTDCFKRFRGMWGLALLDGRRGELVLCRDRMGIKPLYVWNGPSLTAVVSEIKQLLAVPGFQPRVNREAAAEFLSTGYQDPDNSLYEGVRPFPAGSWMRIPLRSPRLASCSPYWRPEVRQPTISSPEEAGELFGAKLRECVKLYLRSDVPVGTALSGGLDSSSIAVLVNSLHGETSPPFHTFTATFPGDRVDERRYVDAVLGTIAAVPHFVTPTPDGFLAELDRFLWMHDEPPTCLSVYAAWCVARTAREAGIPVTLNGQGGDEILAGYWQTYFLYLYGQARTGHLVRAGSHFLGAITPGGNPLLVSSITAMLRRFRARKNGAGIIPFRHAHEHRGPGVLDEIMRLGESERRLYQIRKMFLPRLLRWEDRNSMAFSVEGRYPFLDHDLIELCQLFFPGTLFHSGWTKWPLRLALRPLLPQAVSRRKTKIGYEVPQDGWLTGALRPAVERWLGSDGPVWHYLEPSGARKIAEEAWRLGSSAGEPGQALVRMFIFARWLEVFSLAVD